MAQHYRNTECSSDFLYDLTKEAMIMFTAKGYYTSNGFVGFLPDGSRMMFATYNEYVEYLNEDVAAA